MSFELVYTSAPRGLRDGASGFCTVAATEGIPRLLHEKMESLSGYSRSEVMAGIEPPVNHSHLSVRIQRTVYHIVSRIGDAGIDYSGRTNKIAHHLALTSDEILRFPAGPASLLSDYAFWHTEWTSDPETLPSGNVPNAYAEGVSDFDTWEAIFGDAGWAGVLGQAVAISRFLFDGLSANHGHKLFVDTHCPVFCNESTITHPTFIWSGSDGRVHTCAAAAHRRILRSQ